VLAHGWRERSGLPVGNGRGVRCARQTGHREAGGIRSIGRYRVRLSAWMLIVVTSAVLLKGVPRLGSAVADLTEHDVKEERDRAVD
jgi:hypothetical protein